MKVKVVFSIVQGQSRRTHVARGGSNVQVTVLSDARYGSTTMKSCMGLICYSRPDLIPNQQTDYALSVLDVQETDGLAKSSTSTISEDDKVWEGKGMMSWLLTEKGLGAKVVGRMTGTAGSSDDSQVLEVILELMPRTPILRKDLVQNLTSCSNIIEAALSRALLSQNKQQLLLSHSNTSSPAADQSNAATPLPVNNNDENARLSILPTPETSVQAIRNAPHDLPSMLQILRTSQPGLSTSQAMVILRNALNGSSNSQSDGSLLPSIDLLSASVASTPIEDMSVADLLGQHGLTSQATTQPPKQTLQARNQGLLGVLSAPDLSPATSDILSRFTMGLKNGNNAETSNAKTTRPSKSRTSNNKNEKDATSGIATTSSRKTSGTKRKAADAETIEISDTEGNNKPLPDPIKPSTTSTLRPLPKASTSSHSHVLEKRLKTWEPGCLKCGRTESIGWRIRKKRSTPLNGQKGEGEQEDDDEVKKLCEECAQDLPSVQRRRTGKGKKDNDSSLPFSRSLAASSSAHPTPIDPNRHAQARTIHTTQTSPLRRSPRRNKGKSAAGSGLSTVSMTSPVQAKNTNTGNKRRKFTTALSKAALSEENRHISVPLLGGGDEEYEMTDSDNNNNNNKQYLAISGKRGFSRGQSSPPRLQPMQNQSFDFMLDPASDLPDGFPEAANIDMDLLMNASPGTAIRSALGGGSLSNSTQNTPGNNDNNESPGKMLSRYLKDLQRGGSLEGMNLDIPAFEDLHYNTSTSRGNNTLNDGNLFSPGGALSTPFRNAIFARAHSEQPPSSHQRLQSQLNGGTVNNPSSDEMTLGGDLQINLQPPSADRRLAANTLLSRASPSVAGGKAGNDANEAGYHPPSDSLAIVDDFSTFLLNTSSSLFSPSPPRSGQILSQNSPLRKTLLPSYTSAGTSITKASLASLQLPTTLLRRNSAPHAPLAAAAPSSDFDIESNFDIRDLPPSSPPPLPSAHHHHQSNMQIFLNSLGNNSLDDGQSPISATTSVTAGGTPQEVLLAPRCDPRQGLNPSFSLGTGSRNDGEKDDWLDPALRASTGTYSHKYSLSMDSACQDDTFFDLFTNGNISDSGANTVAAGGSTNMGLTWSDSTASSASLSSMPNQLDPKVGGDRWKNSLSTSASASPVDFSV